MALESMTVKLVGTNPLLMHSNRGVNTLLPETKALKAVTSKRTKSDEDIEQIARLEWELGMYHDADVGPYLPGEMILACIRDAAKKTKQGKAILEAVFLDDAKVKLAYDGPRDIKSLWELGTFYDLRPARVMGRTVNRARPIFPAWSAEFTLVFDGEVINGEDIQRILETAGRRVGLGDYRPTYGRFDVSFPTRGKRVAA